MVSPKHINSHLVSFFCKKPTLLIIVFLLGSIQIAAQKKVFQLIDIETKVSKVKKDSLSATQFLDSLSQSNYFFTKVVDIKESPHEIQIFYDKGNNFNAADIQLDDSLADELKKQKTFSTTNLDSLRTAINHYFVKKGFAFNRVQTHYQGIKNNRPQVKLSVDLGAKRKIDGLVIKGYDKVPKRFRTHLDKEFAGKDYEVGQLLKLQQRLQNHPFVLLEQPPQTLFTKDSTQVFLQLQKKKSNTFDGIIGFGNSESDKFTFNGTLNVVFRNMFNGFEDLSLYWQRNPNKGQNFDLKISIPYLFKSNIGFDAQMNIYRQDSTFATVKMHPGLFYQMSPNQKVGIRGNFELSSVLDSLYTSAKEFNRSGAGVFYDFQKPSSVDLFVFDSRIRTELDFLTTRYDADQSRGIAIRYFILGEKNFQLKGRNYLNIKAESALLNSKNDLAENELFRIGGWNSLRGFNENAILANFYAYGGAEYRYLVNQQAFFDLFAQFGHVQNKSLAANPNFYSLGLGFNFFLPIGLMSFQISNGSQVGNPFNFRDTKIHWGIVSRF